MHVCTSTNRMNNFLYYILILYKIFSLAESNCDVECPDVDEAPVCGYDVHRRSYTLFPSECAMTRAAQCWKKDLVASPLKDCIKQDFSATRREYGESCPVFCPNHYSPVCGQSDYKHYVYRTFINRCYLDMLNCRGGEDTPEYTEVPLKYCQNHLMKNIFKEKVIISDIYDSYRDHF